MDNDRQENFKIQKLMLLSRQFVDFQIPLMVFKPHCES